MAETETATAVATLAPPAADPLMALIQRAATDQEFSVEKLEKLLDVKERWDAEEARKAYVAALACFKRAAPDAGEGQRRFRSPTRATATRRLARWHRRSPPRWPITACRTAGASISAMAGSPSPAR